MNTVLITGAAGGLGTKIAEALIKDYDLILLDYDAKGLEGLKNKFEGKGHKIRAICSDASNYESLSKDLSSIEDLDILINTAGILGPVGIFGQNDMKLWHKTIEVNLLGTVHTCQLLLDKLLKSSHGKIINFSGGGSAYVWEHHSAYAASKSAVVRFTETLAAEYPKLDINVIAPGAHKTKIWGNDTDNIPEKNWSDPARLQELIKYLCSNKSDGITRRFLHINDDWDLRDYRRLPEDMYTLRRIDERLLKNLEGQ